MSLRRRTLGVINHNERVSEDGNTNKRRFSMAPNRRLDERKVGRGARFSVGRPSIGFMKGRKSFGRLSIAPNGRPSIGRRSSMYNRSGKITDPRPLSDRKYINKNTRILVEYLTSHGYDKQITPKQVTAPSLKDFKNIVGFLFKQMDPEFEFSQNLDDIRDILKIIGYPFNISKSSLSAVGSPHTWPPILAMLVWVIELLSYLEKLDAEEENQVANDDGKIFFEFLASAYRNFLDEKDHSAEDLEEGFREANEQRCAVVKDEIKRFEDENDELSKELQELSSTTNTVEHLQKKLSDHVSDLAKFEKLNQKLEKHLEVLMQKEEAAKSTLKELEGEKEQYVENQKNLKVAVEEQPLSRKEVQMITQETKMKKDSIESLLQQKEELKRQVWDSEMLQCKEIGNVEEFVNEYNNLVYELGLKNASQATKNIDYQIKFDSAGNDIKEMVSKDLTHVIKKSLSHLETRAKSELRGLESELRDVKQETIRTTDLRSEAEASLNQHEQRLEKIHEAYRTERKDMNKQCSESISAIEETELHIHRTRTARATELRVSEQKIQEIEEQLKVVLSEQEDIEQKTKDSILSSVEGLVRHKDWIVQTLTTLSDKATQGREGIESMCSGK
mmetsp:Transcript_6008/g.9973  ORF Transcript_6008/g.9973 Transcript_6008/m.9973 type:complete len:617 (-) Transcript_6008:134-1984(-)|eukprot:jgi/Bigna1/87374/estExt_fgenesh1_pg.C_190200